MPALPALEDLAVKHKALLLMCTIVFGSAASSAADEQVFESDALPGESTTAGQMLEKRIMAQTLIDHGKTSSSPESILVGVQILHQNPVVDAKNGVDQKLTDTENLELNRLIDAAIEMRPEDKLLSEMATRVRSELEEKSRGLAGGPKQWTVKIRKGDHFLLDPRLVYDVQQEAIVSARVVSTGDNADDSKSTVGITVARDGSGKSLYTRSVAKQKTQARWNSGPYKAGWYVKIHNLSGPDEATIVIETN
ncbi:MAG: hypothetical protein U0936_17310 [Planctomycetaceae bacterium]